MALSNTYVGRLGQDLLAAWCTQASITANPPLHDERGWDYLLQFAAAGGHAGPLDRAAPELSCMVQVKSTTGSSTSEAISLANWQRMCTDPIPWFVLAVQIDPERAEAVSAHLVHIDDAWCERLFRRLRECTRDQKPDLHRQTMNISWSDADRLDELHGRCLRRAVVAHVGDSQHRYVHRKMQWFDELGYEDPRKRITLTLRAKDERSFYNHMADLGVGLATTLPPGWHAAVSDVRFGIEATLNSFGAEAGEIEFRPPPQGRVSMSVASAATLPATFVCDAYRAGAIFPFLPPEYDRMRLVTDDVSVVIDTFSNEEARGLSMNFAFSIPADAGPLGALSSRVRLARALMNHREDPVSVTLSLGDKSVSLTPDGVGDIDDALRVTIAKFSAAVDICQHFAVDEMTEVDPDDLLEQAPSTQFMAGLLAKAEGDFSAPSLEPVPLGAMFGAQFEAALHLPSRTLVLVSGAWGVVTRTRDFPGLGSSIVVDHGKIAHERLDIDPTTSDAEDQLSAGRARMRAHLEAQGCVAITDADVIREVQARTRGTDDQDGPG